MGDQSSHSPVPGYCTTGRLALGPLLKHLLHGLLHHLLVLVSVAVEGVLRDTAPDQRLRLRIVKIDDHRAFDVLLGVMPPMPPPMPRMPHALYEVCWRMPPLAMRMMSGFCVS